jgi:predicted regulator of Ras-like GTPase activity (Roadblock/LC7/MglB family)
MPPNDNNTPKEWLMDSAAMGRLVLPAFEVIPKKLPQCVCAMLCTPEGFNLCSIGVTPDQLGKVAALASSLISLGEATVNAVNNTPGGELDVLTLQAGELTTVGIKVPHVSGYLLLMVSARSTPLGAILTVARSTAQRVQELLPTATS